MDEIKSTMETGLNATCIHPLYYKISLSLRYIISSLELLKFYYQKQRCFVERKKRTERLKIDNSLNRLVLNYIACLRVTYIRTHMYLVINIILKERYQDLSQKFFSRATFNFAQGWTSMFTNLFFKWTFDQQPCIVDSGLKSASRVGLVWVNQLYFAIAKRARDGSLGRITYRRWLTFATYSFHAITVAS